MNDGDHQHDVIITLIDKPIAIDKTFAKGGVVEFRDDTPAAGKLGDVTRLGNQLGNHGGRVKLGISLDILRDQFQILECLR